MIKTRHFFFTILLLLQVNYSFSQSDKEMEAIVKYQLAEETFDNKEYDKALNYLDEAKKIMGNIPKLSYLQIVIELEKIGNNINNSKDIINLLNLIKTFEKAKGIEGFSQEKKMFVTKNKVLLKEKLSQITAQEEKSKQLAIEAEIKAKIGKENFEKFTIDDLPFGLPLEEFKAKYPAILPEKYKTSEYKNTNGIVAYYPKNISFEDKANFLFPYNSSTGTPVYDTNIHVVFVKDNKVIGFQKNMCYYNSKGQGGLNYQEAVDQIKKYYQNFSESFISIPSTYTSNGYIWVISGEKQIHLYDNNYFETSNKWKQSLIVRVIKLK